MIRKTVVEERLFDFESTFWERGAAIGRAISCTLLVVLCTSIITVPSLWANWIPEGVALSTAAGDQVRCQITSDGAGGAVVTWQDSRSGNNDIYAQRVNSAGEVLWGADGVAICTAPRTQEFPRIASDGAGGAIIVWHDGRVNARHIFAQRVDASGAVLWTRDGVPVCTASNNCYYPQVVSDDQGGAVIVWEDYRVHMYDIFAQRVDAGGALKWSIDGVPVCTAAQDQWQPRIVSDGAGGAIVTWYDWRTVWHPVYAQRVDASGSVLWTTDGVPIFTDCGTWSYPSIASDGAGGAIVAWQDHRSGVDVDFDIYVQKVDGSGAIQWHANGIPVCTNEAEKSFEMVASDGAGGAIVSWADDRTWPDDRIFAQRISVSGEAEWTTDGIVVSAHSGATNQTIISDGEKGAILVWKDWSSGTLELYAQRVNASGATLWTADGVRLCAASSNKFNPTIVSDGTGGTIVAWEEDRGGSGWDTYAQRIDVNGLIPTSATDVPGAPLALSQNFPNPFNPATTVNYSLPEKCSVKLEIFDASGNRIMCLVDGIQDRGFHAAQWQGADASGKSAASGIYFYRLSAGRKTISKKMVLLK